MKLYCVAGRYLRTQKEASDHAKSKGLRFSAETDTVEWPTDQQGIVDALNELVRDLTGPGAPVATQEAHAARVNGQSYTEHSVGIDDTFLNLPISHQLTLSTLAIEHARRVIEHPVEKLVIDHIAKTRDDHTANDLV